MRWTATSDPARRPRALRRYRFVDLARKVVGVGSVGTRCWMVLLEGTATSDPLFLQFKEARLRCSTPYARAPPGTATASASSWGSG